ncbi:hypothetical protein BJ742DRAFT_683527 [Cladochytrium replicatum]|nr:hypothetical protein BJ742DRAFT_683527 [Cladochytrium replicatum]
MTLQRRAPLQRAATLNRLIKAKTVGFIGGLSLLVNAMSGPGIPFVPSLFQVSGWVLPVIAFFVFTIVSSLSVLFIVEAMQAIPGNKHFQGTVEYGTLINFYFGKKAHLLGQFFLCGALLSQAIQSIVLTSQTADDLAFRLTGKTCGLVLSKGLQWKCIQASTFQDWTFLTVGYLGTLVLAIPFFFVNMDNNIQVQICAFFLLFVLLFHWITASILQTTFTIKKLEAIGVGLSSVAGVVLQNLAFTVVVPSWINLKRKDVNAQYTVWSATTIMSAVYIVFGMIAAMGFDDLANNDFMQTMRNKARPTALSLASTYAFTFCMLLPGIPVNLIVAKLNLTQNRVMGKIPATLATFVIPWIVAIPFLRDGTLQGFVDWTSLVFVSTANFVFPIIIYFRCVRFRKSYNADRGIVERFTVS